MRKTNHSIFLFASSFMLLLATSCRNSTQIESNVISDSITTEEEEVVEEPKIIPISEINIKGKWVSNDNPLYPIVEFKGKSTVVIKTILGPYASSYERDEEFIRVKTDKSDLLFEIVSADSIVGSGYTKGHWIKEN